MKTIDEYADEVERNLARHRTLSRADIEMTLIACALGAEVDDTARVEATRRIIAADDVVSRRLIGALAVPKRPKRPMPDPSVFPWDPSSDRVLAREAELDPGDHSPGAEHIREVAGSVRDHREAYEQAGGVR